MLKVPLEAFKKTDTGGAGAQDTFSTVLKDSIDKVNKLQTEADKAIEGLASGEVKNVHETMIAIEKANLSFNMMLQVRNKLLAAYEEVMRMQV
ncbi:MAG: flagellar hook-basal body complex protein FliE [Deltaproteobacteria bacterium]|nr:flagellar hook-basal body complex protein FliE [Deltaproteobacteria bacterium]